MQYYIGADLGTSALKLLLVSGGGEIVKTVSKPYDVFYPRSGWSEQNPADWWDALVSGVGELTTDIDKSSVRGIGVAGQMHGLVVLDEEDGVIRPAILWNDGRTAAETEYLNTVVTGEKLAALTGNIAFAGFTAPKLLWMKNNEPEKFAQIKKIMLPKDYINYLLTGVHCTDYSDAAGMLLLDVRNKCWSEEMLGICGVDRSQMPALFESYDVVGRLSETAANALGLSSDVIVVAGAGDNAAAAIGTGTVSDGRCNISLGTSGTVFVSSKEYCDLKNNAIHSFCHADGGYHVMACILSAASCNSWFCGNILGTEDYKTEEADITDDMLGRNKVFFLPYLMGERSPINDTDATGMFIGMRADTSRADMLQAVLEGVAFAIRDNMEIIADLGIDVAASTLCGGGAKSKLWQKIMANVLDIDINIPIAQEGPGMGGAVLAMVGDGLFEDVSSAAAEFTGIKSTVTPDAGLVALYNERYERFKQIYPTVKQLCKNIK